MRLVCDLVHQRCAAVRWPELFGAQEALDEMSAVHPIGRIGRPEEIADAVAWLFSDRSSYYTGQSLILDGGLAAQRPYVTQPPASDKRLQNVRDERPFQGIHLD
jgi:hypothetical protein